MWQGRRWRGRHHDANTWCEHRRQHDRRWWFRSNDAGTTTIVNRTVKYVTLDVVGPLTVAIVEAGDVV
jgi:hypothetical protein